MGKVIRNKTYVDADYKVLNSKVNSFIKKIAREDLINHEFRLSNGVYSMKLTFLVDPEEKSESVVSGKIMRSKTYVDADFKVMNSKVNSFTKKIEFEDLIGTNYDTDNGIYGTNIFYMTEVKPKEEAPKAV